VPTISVNSKLACLVLQDTKEMLERATTLPKSPDERGSVFYQHVCSAEAINSNESFGSDKMLPYHST
jgi:hypothetical protein